MHQSWGEACTKKTLQSEGCTDHVKKGGVCIVSGPNLLVVHRAKRNTWAVKDVQVYSDWRCVLESPGANKKRGHCWSTVMEDVKDLWLGGHPTNRYISKDSSSYFTKSQAIIDIILLLGMFRAIKNPLPTHVQSPLCSSRNGMMRLLFYGYDRLIII